MFKSQIVSVNGLHVLFSNAYPTMAMTFYIFESICVLLCESRYWIFKSFKSIFIVLFRIDKNSKSVLTNLNFTSKRILFIFQICFQIVCLLSMYWQYPSLLHY